MELMHAFVKGCMYSTSGMYIFSRGAGYLVCDARVEWMTKHYNLNTPGSYMILEFASMECNHFEDFSHAHQSVDPVHCRRPAHHPHEGS